MERDIGLPDDDLPIDQRDDAWFAARYPSYDDLYQGDVPPRAVPSPDGLVSEWACPATGGFCRKPPACDDPAFVPHHAWGPDRKLRFLHHLAEKGDVRAACARVGMSRQSAYLLRRRDGAFAQGWQAALVLARRHAEEVLATRALDGIEEAVWFRGELVGKKRRYDTRLLLAHLARLDRMAEEAGPCEDRFDELLAMVAGERPEAHFEQDEAGAEGADAVSADARVLEADRALEDWGGAHDPLPLPPGRAAYVLSSAEPAWIAANGAWDEAAGEVERAYEEAHGFAPHEEDRPEHLPDAVYPPLPLYAVFREASAARWDGWQGCAFGRVDAALTGEGGGVPDGPVEYKSLTGPGLVCPLDRVKRVNLSAGRAVRTVRRMRGAGGNGMRAAWLSRGKAGAALPLTPLHTPCRPTFLPKDQRDAGGRLSRSTTAGRAVPGHGPRGRGRFPSRQLR
ncbi:hypothetical protein [Novosphingobium mangrovi (ex Huang et al. 2023)]|uniref:YqaJ viral recombinase domain-containing protein n=1 Tax=Novosphingobium mangrovi (ex Huang et al. 2023) TaxID=2976432 RepID=A0ABT2I5G4_9SPHN|nr:hypothetical protein [Novosphingobium mangrovi (ex Huang et al. 2023)]MCT2399838.1 hypothetical protein [Novosphingobium mangrovi (ex Huang et al. 2023)]